MQHSTYTQQLIEKVEQLNEALAKEFRLQGKRKNRESEKRTRKLLRSVVGIYEAYRDASLDDKKATDTTKAVV